MNFLRKIKRVINLLKFDAEKQTILNNELKEWVLYINKTSLNLEYNPKLQILNVDDSIDKILKCPKTFIRFGDGELLLIDGYSIPFQKYNKKLAIKLKEILMSNGDYYKCIPNYYLDKLDLSSYSNQEKEYIYLNYFHRIKTLEKICPNNGLYLNAGISLLYMCKRQNKPLDYYYEKLSKLFINNNVVVLGGAGLFKQYKFNFFDFYNIKYITIECPKKNAYRIYRKLLKMCKKYPLDTVFAFSIGPTSKVLCYELNKAGYKCYDIGHLFKDFNAYKTNFKKTIENISKFYMPD